MGNNKIFGLSDVIDSDKYKKKTVEEIITKNKKDFIKLCKLGYFFDDEVCKKAGYTKTIRNVRYDVVYADRQITKNNKKYSKDTKSVKEILKSLAVLDNSQYDDDLYEKEENLDTFELETENFI